MDRDRTLLLNSGIVWLRDCMITYQIGLLVLDKRHLGGAEGLVVED